MLENWAKKRLFCSCIVDCQLRSSGPSCFGLERSEILQSPQQWEESNRIEII